jgi:hypothetical protein
MSAPEGFLTRWSRLKRTAEAPSPEAASPDAVAAKTGVAEVQEPVVDLSTLPSLESIAADTDVSVFMKPGVPASLRDAAIRRAWAADPAIRDFRGLQENDWDFTNADAVPGFGTFASREEVERAARALFDAAVNEPPKRADRAENAPPQVSATGAYEVLDKNQGQALPAPASPAPPDEPQQSARNLTNAVRRHGGALPT